MAPFSRVVTCALLAACLTAPPAAAQTAPPAPGAPAPAPPLATPAPPPAAATPPPAVAQSAPGERPTLVPGPGDPNDVDEVTLPPKPAAILSGRSTWDDGFNQLRSAFARLEAELRRAGVAPAGRPLAVFVETDDIGFRYDAMIPVARAPEGSSALAPEIRYGTTPEGRALRFVHESPYDDIDSTYETITAYLEAKGVAVQDAFIEEYATDLEDSADPDLRINIFVRPR